MSTIINQDQGQDQNNDSSNSSAILVVAVIVIFVIFFVFLLPRIYNSTPIEVNPSTVNVNPQPDILRDTPMDPVNPDNSSGGPLSTMPGTSIAPAPGTTPAPTTTP